MQLKKNLPHFIIYGRYFVVRKLEPLLYQVKEINNNYLVFYIYQVTRYQCKLIVIVKEEDFIIALTYYVNSLVLVQSSGLTEADSDIPSDAIGPGSCYTPIDLPPLDSWIEIYVANVASPGQFWFQLRGPKTSLALERLMNQLE